MMVLWYNKRDNKATAHSQCRWRGRNLGLVGATMNSIPPSPGVYRITCTTNHKVYIGSTTNLRRRTQRHARLLRSGTHFSAHMQAAWNLYGESAFVFDVIEEVADTATLVEREQHWLDHYRANDNAYGFNKAKRAESPMLGLSHTDEARRKIGAASRLWARSEETKQKQSVAKMGMGHTAESRRKMSIAKTGRAMPEADRVKRSKHFIVTSPEGEEFEIIGLRPFCREHNLNYGNMQSVAAGRALTCKGWRVRRI